MWRRSHRALILTDGLVRRSRAHPMCRDLCRSLRRDPCVGDHELIWRMTFLCVALRSHVVSLRHMFPHERWSSNDPAPVRESGNACALCRRKHCLVMLVRLEMQGASLKDISPTWRGNTCTEAAHKYLRIVSRVLDQHRAREVDKRLILCSVSSLAPAAGWSTSSGSSPRS